LIKRCFSINNYLEAVEIISICKKLKKIPVLYVRHFIIKGFGINWLNEFNKLIREHHKIKDYKLYIDVKKNYGLFINLVEHKVNYIRVVSDKDTLIKLKQIAKINKVTVNPDFSIVDLKKIKNLPLKIKKTYE